MVPRCRLRRVGDESDEAGGHQTFALIDRRTVHSRDVTAATADTETVALRVNSIRAALLTASPRLEDWLEPDSGLGTAGLDHNRSQLLNVLIRMLRFWQKDGNGAILIVDELNYCHSC